MRQALRMKALQKGSFEHNFDESDVCCLRLGILDRDFALPVRPVLLGNSLPCYAAFEETACPYRRPVPLKNMALLRNEGLHASSQHKEQHLAKGSVPK
jgi:hypothetical protein